MENFRAEFEKIDRNDNFMFSELQTLRDIHKESSQQMTQGDLNNALEDYFGVDEKIASLKKGDSRNEIIEKLGGQWWSEDIAIIQIYLKNEGFYRGSIDGKAGKGFFRAIETKINSFSDKKIQKKVEASAEVIKESTTYCKENYNNIIIGLSYIEKNFNIEKNKGTLVGIYTQAKDFFDGKNEDGTSYELVEGIDKIGLKVAIEIYEKKLKEIGLLNERVAHTERRELKEKVEKVFEADKSNNQLTREAQRLNYYVSAKNSHFEEAKNFLEKYKGYFMPREDGKKEGNRAFLKARDRYTELALQYNQNNENEQFDLPLEIITSGIVIETRTGCSRNVKRLADALGINVPKHNASSIPRLYNTGRYENISHGSSSINSIKNMRGNFFDLVGSDHRAVGFEDPNSKKVMIIDPYYPDKDGVYHNGTPFPYEDYSKKYKFNKAYGYNVAPEKLEGLLA